MFSRSSQLYAESTLRERGVQVHLGVAVKEVTPDGVILSNGVEISSKTVIWAGGVRAAAMPAQPELPRSSSGRIEVQNDLSVHGFAGVYAIGDLANATRADGKPLPQLAAVAQQAGQHCARNIITSIEGEPSRSFVYKDRGILAMIGRNAAVAEFGKAHHEFVGPIAFATWLGVHAALLTAPRARLEAIEEWAWEYFAGEHAGQLIDE
jgi:NADH dehydrogenase